jgi:hypothetical protein
MVTKFQFRSVEKLVDSGVYNYVQIRQQVGLTSDELDDILENLEYYKKKFDEEDRLAEIERLKSEKKPWWKRK